MHWTRFEIGDDQTNIPSRYGAARSRCSRQASEGVDIDIRQEYVVGMRRFLRIAFLVVFAAFASDMIAPSGDMAMAQGSLAMVHDTSGCEDCCDECGDLAATSCSIGCVAPLLTTNDLTERTVAPSVELTDGASAVHGGGRTLPPDPGPPRIQA